MEPDPLDLRVPADPPFGRRAGIDLFDALGTTRSIRRFTDEPIPPDDLAALLFAATRAPTGSNRQRVRWLVLRDDPSAAEPRRLLGEAARQLWSAKRSDDGYDQGSGARPDSPKARMAATMADFTDHFDRVPVIVLPVLRRHREPTPTEGGSVYPGVQNLLLAARGLGYGGVITMFHQFVEDELTAVLGVPEGAAIMATVALGRPVGGHGPVRRLPLADVVDDGRYGAGASWAVEPTNVGGHTGGPPVGSGS